MRINLYILNYLSLGGQLRPVLEVPGEHVAVLIAGVVGLQPLGVQYRVGMAEQILGGQLTFLPQSTPQTITDAAGAASTNTTTRTCT